LLEITKDFEGSPFIKKSTTSGSTTIKRWAKEFMDEIPCPVCEGSRLKKKLNSLKSTNKITVCAMDISDLTAWLDLDSRLSDKQQRIATEVIKEIKDRLNFFNERRFEYLALSRSSKSLSGGEAQRIRLATQMVLVVGVLYILMNLVVYTKRQ
jgi:excinuclease ABC subunit A